jgi:hypothetical protein
MDGGVELLATDGGVELLATDGGVELLATDGGVELLAMDGGSQGVPRCARPYRVRWRIDALRGDHG